ncbi:hypothetical protein [Altericroceibacterium spongiae]|nr:hypothetical protein [Altericroceibacterium spongiae]
MTIRFSASEHTSVSPWRRFAASAVCGPACNDNDPEAPSDSILRAALRLFAEHGLSAARHARDKAEDAFFAADREAYRWWFAVCQALDRKVAAEVNHYSDDGQQSL